jgi:hypothetical protein
MITLGDGTVIPSYLGIESRGEGHGSEDNLLNHVLRYGEVKDIVYPGDKRNHSGNQIEYEVEVKHRDGVGIETTTVYRGVTANNLFGGAADRVETTYRPASQSDKETGNGNGSKVLLLCVSGDIQKPVIIGGLSNPSQKATKAEGHHYTFEFNGAQFKVNSEGEVEFQHRGPTNADGSVKEQYEDYSGANVRVDKRGNITISGPGGEQFLTFTKQKENAPERNQTVELQGDKKLQARAEQVEVTASNNLFLESENEAIQMNAQRGVFVGLATDQWVKGSTYRLAEGALNQTTSTAMSTAAGTMNSAAVSLGVAAGLNAIPSVGGLLAMPVLMAVAAQLAAVGTTLGTISAALTAMEQNAASYLSDKNWTD